MDNSRRETTIIYLRISRLILVGEVSGKDVWDFILEVDQLRRSVDAVARGVRGVVDLDQHNSVPREKCCWFYYVHYLFRISSWSVDNTKNIDLLLDLPVAVVVNVLQCR